jgi:hypothetical protein
MPFALGLMWLELQITARVFLPTVERVERAAPEEKLIGLQPS